MNYIKNLLFISLVTLSLHTIAMEDRENNSPPKLGKRKRTNKLSESKRASLEKIAKKFHGTQSPFGPEEEEKLWNFLDGNFGLADDIVEEEYQEQEKNSDQEVQEIIPSIVKRRKKLSEAAKNLFNN